MRRLIRRVVLWAMPELRATVEREQWIAAFWQAAAAQQHMHTPDVAQPVRAEVN